MVFHALCSSHSRIFAEGVLFTQGVYLTSFSWISQRSNCLTALEASRKQLEMMPRGHFVGSPIYQRPVELKLPQLSLRAFIKPECDTNSMFFNLDSPPGECEGRDVRGPGSSQSHFFGLILYLHCISRRGPTTWDLARTEVRSKGFPLAIKRFFTLGRTTVTECWFCFLI